MISLEKLVNDLEEESQVLIKGIYCKQCSCFHYELGPYVIFEYLVNKEKDTSAETVGKYLTDYDIKLAKMKEEIPV